MAVKFLAKSGRTAALALSLAAIIAPGLASARPDDEGRPERSDRVREESPRGNPGGNGGGGQAWGGRSNTGWSAPQANTPPPAPQPQPSWRGGGNHDGGGRGQGWGGSRPNGGWQGGNTPAPPPTATPAPQPTNRWNGGQWNGGQPAWRGPQPDQGTRGNGWQGNGRRDGDRDRDGDRHRDGQWNGSNGNGRDGDRWRTENQRRYNEQWRDNQWRGHNGSWSNDRYRGNDQHRWDRRWRSNNRYDWQSYRRYNPSIYRWGTYYSPYRGYSYRRLNIGFFLDSLFFSSNYWIDDPWQYRLPDVYGPYRWVRYYDDALLVNIYSGEVVDVIYSFFW